ncbi:NTE family protein [Sphingomonas guangdongensis]|uniref:NTE family protein n=1 Tax=Sphingomonas guangdongensis TaxID=1141890 RepID=A0A285QBQ8_9SPHN|nr:patatin-like phospholipase family protein [Sphingomonas guangdongensis]SOB79370.1 NTE family protein [Sphingomonas guangdongensis]
MATSDEQAPSARIALVLSGGNALGAYQAGAYQALDEAGWLPDWVVGASAGAINGAILCGNPPERRLAALEGLWRPAYDASESHPAADQSRRTGAAALTLAAGQPGLFTPRSMWGPWWNPFGNPEPSSLYDTTPMLATLAALVDVDTLNDGHPRCSITAVDVATGEDVVFDSARRRLEHAHVRASAALLPAFPPVEVDGRLLGDAGISANLPLDVVLAEPGDAPLLCVAIDLLPLRAPPPATLGETVSRMQDLMFATQSRRALAAWQALYAAQGPDAPAVTVLHIAYRAQEREVSGKAFDFSGASAAHRWQSGREDVARAVAQVRGGGLVGQPGLTVLEEDDGGRWRPVTWPMRPIDV